MTTTGPTTTHDGPGRAPGRSFAAMFDAICTNKADVIRLTVTCLVAGGHLLIEDVPGVGKTTIAKALARSVDGRFGRVQFTPDLLPSDVLGSSVWNQSNGAFEFRPGPVFHNLVLSDEINRASPKTQSALLEAMAEEQVTVDGTTYPLPRPFMVVATQNPLEHQGTFPLPESQLDRFLMRLSVGYPDRASEVALLVEEDHDDRLDRLRPVVSTEDVLAMGAAASRVYVAEALAAYLVELADRSRRSAVFSLGVSPRAALGLLGAARVHAAADGRDFVAPDDVKDLARPVLAHRVVLSPEAQLQGMTAEEAVGELLRTTPVPG
jgi:MoxR-like ATPase